MSVSERKLKKDLDSAKYYYENRNFDVKFENLSKEIIQKCYEPFRTNLVQAINSTPSDSIVELAEVAFDCGLQDIAKKLIDIYFELEQSNLVNKNNFYIRALLVKAQVKAEESKKKELKAEAAIKSLLDSINDIQKGVEFIAKPENKEKYSTILYNASIITVNILKRYLKINWSNNFWEILEKISNQLEDNDDMDFNWRIFILIKLAEAYYDADKKAECSKSLDKIADILKKKGDCDFMEEVYRIRIHLNRDNNGALGNIKKDGETSTTYPQFRYLYTVQAIKSGIIQEKDLDKEVNGIITAICPDFYKNIDSKTNKYVNQISIKLESWKADVLAELSYILLRFENYINLAFNLFTFLSQSGSCSLKGKIYIENVRSQKIMNDLEENLKENVQPNDIVIQKRIETLADSLMIMEKNMAGCARLQDYDLINETSMLIFNSAKPFFKKSLRKYLFKPFYTSVEQLENIQSNESLLRAAMHYELSKYYMNEELLQEANSQILKALTNDYSIPLNKLSFDNTNTNANNAKDAKKGGAKQTNQVNKDDPNFQNSITNNVSYHQRYLEQYLIYLKRYIGVKVNMFNDPETIVDQLIFESDNLKNTQNIDTQNEIKDKLVELINSFKIEEFDVEKFRDKLENKNSFPHERKELVESEIAELKEKYDLQCYDDKKHFINICSEICDNFYTDNFFEEILNTETKVNEYLEELSTFKDINQLISISQIKLNSAKVYSEYLLEEGVELYSNNYDNFNIQGKVYTDTEKEKIDNWRLKLREKIQEANKIATSVNQYWLVFNICIEFWNGFLPLIDNPSLINIINEDLLNLFNELFESMNAAMIYYEGINAEPRDTDYYKKTDIFVRFTQIYTKILSDKQKFDECVKICETMLTRKLSSKARKIFDTIKTRAINTQQNINASEAGAGGKGKKQPAANQKANAQAGGKGKGGDNTGFVPSQDMTLISECFTALENAINITNDEKAKFEALKKGTDQLSQFNVNFNDENTLELSSELWYKYGCEFFSNKNYKNAVFCADNCTKTYDNIDIEKISGRKDTSLELKKWYCLGFLLYGDSLLKLIDKDKQERLAQIKIYFGALEKIILSAKISEKCKQYNVILNDLKAFYSIIINIIDQSQNRITLCKHFQNLHDILINNRAGGGTLYSDPEFLLLFYSLFCLCINETKNWELGEKIIGDAMRIIPNQYHHVLLEHKLFYYSKQGKSFLQSFENQSSNKNSDVLTKAKLYIKLAENSLNKSDQFRAYNKAIELLKTDENIYVCNAIFMLSSWLYKNNYPFSDIEDNLNQAADIILEIEPIFDDEDDLDEDEGKTLHSKRSASSRTSRLSKRSKSKLSSKSKQSKHKSTVSKKSSRSKASERSKTSRKYSKKSSNTKTIFAKMLDYDPYPLFMNIQHLEYLFKIEVFLSMVTNDITKKQNYLLDAFYVIKKIIELSLKTLSIIDFFNKNKEEIEKMNFIGNDLNPLSSLISHYYIERDINIPMIYSMPETLDQWLTYEFPENFIEKIKEENNNNNTPSDQLNTQNISIPNYTYFCKKSFEKPYQFFYYLNYLLNNFMNESFYHSECIFLIKFGQIFSKFILENKDLEFSFNLKLYRLINNICINENLNNISKEIFDNINLITNNKPTLKSEIINEERDKLRIYSLNLDTNTEEYFLPVGIDNLDSVIRYADDLKSHIGWIELAKEYYYLGYYNYAKEYSTEALFHSLVLKDKDSFIESNLILANINFIESEFEESSKLFNKIQTINQDPSYLYVIVKNMTNIFNYMNKFEEEINFLNNVIEYFDKIYEKQVKNDKYTSSKILFYEIYTFAIINKIIANIKQTSENILINEYNIIKEQKSNMNAVLNFFKNKIFPLLKKFNDMIQKSSYNLQIIFSLFEFINVSIECLLKNNLFVYVNKEELAVICGIFERCLNILEDISNYLNNLQTYVPLRLDNSIAYMPVHRIIAYTKIMYAKINNLIGEFKNRIKRESFQSQKLDINDKNIKSKFGENTKFNQEVIDYINGLTKKISKMNDIENRDKIENMNRYEKSISLLGSCESLIPKVSNEYLFYFIEKINSFRLQALHFKELKKVWDISILDVISKMNTNTEEENPTNENENNNEDQNKNKDKTIVIQKFHQNTINLISDFEKNILNNENYIDILENNPDYLMKYFYNILETTGYYNIELCFKALSDYQNSIIKKYFNQVINRYLNSNMSDWNKYSLYKRTLQNFSFDCDFEKIYETNTLPESIRNYKNYINDIPYFQNSKKNFYNSFTELKEMFPQNSSYLIFQMNEDKSILYIGMMYYLNDEYKYYIKRIILNREINGKIDEMIQNIKTLKHMLIKTVIVTEDEMNKLFLDENEKINKILYDLENNLNEDIKNAFIDLNNIINPEIKTEENEETNTNKKDNKKKDAKKDVKKDNKKDNKGGNPNIELPTSGLESITFLIDIRLYDLPFESLSIFDKIPYKSNDFSINTNVMRLKNANYQKGSPSISLPGNVKYYLDYNLEQKIKYDIKQIISDNLSSNVGGGKKDKNADPSNVPLEGVCSFEHKPSIAELQKIYLNSSTFIFTSQTAFLYQFPYEIFNTSRYSKCKIGFIFDRIANIKNYVDQNSLIPKTFNFNYQPIDTVAMMTLCGVVDVFTTKWSINYDEISEILNDIINESVVNGDNISYSINKYKTPKRVPLENKEEKEEEKKDNKKDAKKDNKKKEEVVLDETNSVEVKKMNLFKLSPILFGLNNVKLV